MTDYYEIFMTQFFTTLAQLTAGILSASVAVPVYSYYTRGNFYLVDNQEHFNEIHKTNSMENNCSLSESVTETETETTDNEVQVSNEI